MQYTLYVPSSSVWVPYLSRCKLHRWAQKWNSLTYLPQRWHSTRFSCDSKWASKFLLAEKDLSHPTKQEEPSIFTPHISRRRNVLDRECLSVCLHAPIYCMRLNQWIYIHFSFLSVVRHNYCLNLRCAKYKHAGLVSKNPLVKYFFCKAKCDLLRTIGFNITNLMYKYSKSEKGNI